MKIRGPFVDLVKKTESLEIKKDDLHGMEFIGWVKDGKHLKRLSVKSTSLGEGLQLLLREVNEGKS